MYEELALRHLHKTGSGEDQRQLRDEEWLKKLDEFIRSHKGKRYRLNPMELIKSSVSKSPTPHNSHPGEYNHGAHNPQQL
jgi:hypothetical protein